jgi:DNA repair protein RadC
MNKNRIHKFSVGHRKRMFEKVLTNHHLTNIEILEILLFFVHKRKDTKPIAKTLIKNFGTLLDVCSAKSEKLMEINGIGPSSIQIIKVFYNLTNMVLYDQIKSTDYLNGFNDIVKYCQFKLSYKKTEELHVIFLNTKNAIISIMEFPYGEVDNVNVSPREIFKQSLERGASSIVLTHNHPSKDPYPSSADIEITKQIQQMLSVVQIKLIDHLIIGGNDYFSFRKNSLI